MNIHEIRHGWHEYSWHTSRLTWIFMSTRHGWHEYSWHTSRVTWIFMSTRHAWHEYSWVCHGWHEFTSPITEYSWEYVTGDMNNHETRHGWHEYSWVHVTGDIFISTRHVCYTQEYMSRVTFKSSRNRWQNIHEHKSRVTELWVHVTGDMNIHEYTSKVTWILWVHFTGTWIFMITHHVGHEYWTWIFPGEYSWLHTHGGHEYSWMAHSYPRVLNCP